MANPLNPPPSSGTQKQRTPTGASEEQIQTFLREQYNQPQWENENAWMFPRFEMQAREWFARVVPVGMRLVPVEDDDELTERMNRLPGLIPDGMRDTSPAAQAQFRREVAALIEEGPTHGVDSRSL